MKREAARKKAKWDELLSTGDTTQAQAPGRRKQIRAKQRALASDGDRDSLKALGELSDRKWASRTIPTVGTDVSDGAVGVNDVVMIVSGKYKGSRGVVVRPVPTDSTLWYVERIGYGNVHPPGLLQSNTVLRRDMYHR